MEFNWMLRCLLITVVVTLLVDAIKPIKLPLTKRRSKLQNSEINPKFANKSVPTHQSDFSLLFNNDYFTVGINLGTPQQYLSPSLDMVDRTLSVLRYDYYPLTHDQNIYDCRISSTNRGGNNYNQYNREFYFTGIAHTDVFSITEDLSYSSQSFAEMQRTYKYPNSQFEFLSDGILGFGIPGANSNETTSASLNILKQLSIPLYTVYIENHVPPSAGVIGGHLTLGSYDQDNCGTERFKPLPLFKGPNWFYNWAFVVNSIKIRQYARKVDRKAYVNVGQSTISLPTAEFNGLLKQIPYTFKNGLYITACNQADAPIIVLSISGNDFKIAGRNYIIDMELGNNQCVLAVEEGSGDNTNLLGLGVPFLEGYCTSINVVDHTINFAPVLVNPE